MADAIRVDLDRLKQWIGRTEVLTDRVTVAPLRALAAILDRDPPEAQAGDAIPPCWHWLYCLAVHPQSQLGPDGHPARGGFLPPVSLPRRMWAGSTLEFRGPLRVGDAITRSSRVVDVSVKEGRTGSLVFVKVRHEVSNAIGLVVVEDQDLVYREAPAPGAAPARETPAPGDAQWVREIHAGDVLLFRYSAVTFNGHRIHYDRRYATEVEGYPDLVVHGPLTATLLLDLLHRQRPDARVARFTFRGVTPLFANAPFQVCGRSGGDGTSVALWAQRPDGTLAMEATASLA